MRLVKWLKKDINLYQSLVSLEDTMSSDGYEIIESIIKESDDEYNNTEHLITQQDENIMTTSQEKNIKNFLISQSVLLKQKIRKKRDKVLLFQIFNQWRKVL